MASVAILGTCPVCDEFIWEDDWDIYYDVMMHEECKAKFIADKLKITNGQFDKLSKEKMIIKEIADLKSEMKSSFEYYSMRIDELEKMLKQQ